MNIHTSRPGATRARCWAAAALAIALAATGLGADVTSARQELYRRIALVSPRDARAMYELATWCVEQSLETEARKLLERVLRIDPDHADARAALGYRRHGLEWRIGDGEAPAGIELPPADPAAPPAPAAPAPPPPSPAPGPTAPPAGGPEATPAPGTGPGTGPAPAPAAITDPVAAKRAFAAEAEAKLKSPFTTREDDDFLVHTTHDANAAPLRELTNTLKIIKKRTQAILGSAARGDIWPEKIQIFLLRAGSECVQFSEVVDGKRFPEREGWYTQDQHTVFYSINDEVLSRLLGESALDKLDGSDRYVNWWLRIGLAETLVTQSEEGQTKERARRAYELLATTLEGDPDAFHVADLVETPGMNPRRLELSRAQALSFFEFLFQASRARLQKLIVDLKSPAAPAPPADLGDAEVFRKFFIDYLAYQEDLINKAYRMTFDQLDQRWKAYIVEKAKELEK